MSRGISGRGYVPALDGLRALAVIGVLAFHDDRLNGGFLGVDLFFALSGFLITSLLVAEYTSHGTIDLVGFWGRRLRRLLPAVLALLVVTVIVFRIFADSGEWIIARTDAPWAQFYVANWHQIAGGNGYWDRFAAPSAFEHLWSLAIEEQFYLVWPVVTWWALRSGGPRRVTAIAGVGAVVSIAAMVLLFDGGDPTRVYMGTDTRAFSLLAGALFATPLVRGPIERWMEAAPRAGQAMSVAAIGALATMWVLASGTSTWLFRGGLAAHSFIAAALTVTLVAGVPIIDRALSIGALRLAGRLSYSLYLWHWPVFVLMSPGRINADRWVITILRMVVTVALASASYLIVELPVRHRVRWAHGAAGRRVFAGSTAVAVAVWVAIPIPTSTNTVGDSALQSVLDTTTTSATTTTTSIALTTVASTAVPNDRTSTTSSTTSSTTTSTSSTTTTIVPSGPPVTSLLWFGDSIAYDTWPPLEAVLTAAGIESHTAAYGGVGLVARDGFTEPFGHITRAIDDAQPDLIVMQLSLWDGYEDPADQIAAFDELGSLIDERDLRLAIVTLPVRSPEEADPGEAVLVDNARSFASQHSDRVVFLDQREVFGDTFRFDIDGDGNPERKRDGVHLCPTGALAVTFWLIKQLSVHYEGIEVPESADWVIGEWRSDPRYDDPPGACAAL